MLPEVVATGAGGVRGGQEFGESALVREHPGTDSDEMGTNAPKPEIRASARVSLTLMSAEGPVLDDDDLLQGQSRVAEGLEGAVAAVALPVDGPEDADTGHGDPPALGGGVDVGNVEVRVPPLGEHDVREVCVVDGLAVLIAGLGDELARLLDNGGGDAGEGVRVMPPV